MNEHELLQIINVGESSKVQLKVRLNHPDSLAHEIIAILAISSITKSST